MDIRSQVIDRRIYSLELRYKICREHLADGTKAPDTATIAGHARLAPVGAL
jgi:hypothetical protein